MSSETEITFKQIQEWLDEYIKTNNPKTKAQLKNLIAIGCLPFVKRISRGLARRSTDPVEDLIQVGSIGLVKAIKFYDADVSRNFKTYATYLITGEIKHYLRDKASMIKAPRQIQELSIRVANMTNELTEKLGDKPTDEQIANEMQIPVKKIQEANEVERRKHAVSLDQMVMVGDDYFPLSDKIVDEHDTHLQKLQEDNILLKTALEKLDENLKDVIEMHYFQDLSQSEIAARLDISQMQVSRLIKKALEKLFIIIKSKG